MLFGMFRVPRVVTTRVGARPHPEGGGPGRVPVRWLKCWMTRAVGSKRGLRYNYRPGSVVVVGRYLPRSLWQIVTRRPSSSQAGHASISWRSAGAEVQWASQDMLKGMERRRPRMQDPGCTPRAWCGAGAAVVRIAMQRTMLVWSVAFDPPFLKVVPASLIAHGWKLRKRSSSQACETPRIEISTTA